VARSAWKPGPRSLSWCFIEDGIRWGGGGGCTSRCAQFRRKNYIPPVYIRHEHHAGQNVTGPGDTSSTVPLK
jgi:hypothetical protein